MASLPTQWTPGYTLYEGRVCCLCLAEWLPVYERMLLKFGVIQYGLDIWQLTGDAAASSLTHSQGGAADTFQYSDLAIKIAREMGAYASWRRTTAQGFSRTHAHMVLTGCPHNSPARYQIDAVRAGYNGLGTNGRGGLDYHPDPSADRTWTQGIAWANAQLEPPKEWWEMTIPDTELTRIRDAVMSGKVEHPTAKTSTGEPVYWTLAKAVWSNWYYTLENRDALTAITKTLSALVASETLDDAEREAAIDLVKAQLAEVLERLEVAPPPVDPEPVNPWPAIVGPSYGVDVSGHQSPKNDDGTPNLALVKEIAANPKFKFAIVKATEGKGFRNYAYPEQIDVFRTAELMTGAYLFNWCTNNPLDDLTNFVDYAGLRLGEIMVDDAENWDQVHNYADMANAGWDKRLEYHLTLLEEARDYYGAPPWIYMNWNWIKGLRTACGVTLETNWAMTEKWDRLTQFPLWIATAGQAPGQHDTVNGGWQAGIVCHQYTASPYDQDYMASAAPHEVWWASGSRRVA